MKSKFVFTKQIKEMAKICFNTLKIIVVKYGEIWFPWWNMVLCSTTKLLITTRNTTDNKLGTKIWPKVHNASEQYMRGRTG